jgi:hypothetical protein
VPSTFPVDATLDEPDVRHFEPRSLRILTNMVVSIGLDDLDRLHEKPRTLETSAPLAVRRRR